MAVAELRQSNGIKTLRHANRMNEPLSETNVSGRLAQIQRRCGEIMQEPEEPELFLIETRPAADSYVDPYNTQLQVRS
jgi:hypothetical protein